MKMVSLWFFRDSGISDTNDTRKDLAEIYRISWDIQTYINNKNVVVDEK